MFNLNDKVVVKQTRNIRKKEFIRKIGYITDARDRVYAPDYGEYSVAFIGHEEGKDNIYIEGNRCQTMGDIWHEDELELYSDTPRDIVKNELLQEVMQCLI